MRPLRKYTSAGARLIRADPCQFFDRVKTSQFFREFSISLNRSARAPARGEIPRIAVWHFLDVYTRHFRTQRPTIPFEPLQRTVPP
jgi:hypothetical protein